MEIFRADGCPVLYILTRSEYFARYHTPLFYQRKRKDRLNSPYVSLTVVEIASGVVVFIPWTAAWFFSWPFGIKKYLLCTPRSPQVVKFNQSDVRHIITTGEHKTMFWGWEHGGLRGYIPKISRHDFKKARLMLQADCRAHYFFEPSDHLQLTTSI